MHRPRAWLISLLALAVTGVGAPQAQANRARAALPVVTSISPQKGSTVGYTHVNVHGRNFTGTTRVTFGRKPAVSVQVVSSTTLSVYAPPKYHGRVWVDVTTRAGKSRPTSASYFTYVNVSAPAPWRVSASTPPADLPAGTDMNVADNDCPDVSHCYAVGLLGNAQDGYQGAFVQTRTGDTVTSVRAPMPAGTTADERDLSTLTDVSCTSAGFCGAVGTYSTGGDVGVLLLTLVGGQWTATAGAIPAGITPQEDGVTADRTVISCGAEGVCVASGVLSYIADDDNQETPVLYELRAGTWAPRSTPAVAETLACSGPNSCIGGVPGYPSDRFAVRTASGWTTHNFPTPQGYGYDNSQRNKFFPDVEAVDCATAGQCTFLVQASRPASLRKGPPVITWFARVSGTAVSYHRIGLPSDRRSAGTSYGSTDELGLNFYDRATVVCPSVSTCFVTERYAIKARFLPAEQAIVAQLSGSRVSIHFVPEAVSPKNGRASASYLDCASATSCVVAGGTNGGSAATYAVFADGVWRPGRLPGVSAAPRNADYRFVAISCPAADRCAAHATYYFAPDDDGLDYQRTRSVDARQTP